MVFGALFSVLGVLAQGEGRFPSSDPHATQWGYVWLGWGVAAVAVITYTVIILLRGRALSKRVPPEERRWM
jgi:hypothetical protein